MNGREGATRARSVAVSPLPWMHSTKRAVLGQALDRPIDEPGEPLDVEALEVPSDSWAAAGRRPDQPGGKATAATAMAHAAPQSPRWLGKSGWVGLAWPRAGFKSRGRVASLLARDPRGECSEPSESVPSKSLEAKRSKMSREWPKEWISGQARPSDVAQGRATGYNAASLTDQSVGEYLRGPEAESVKGRQSRRKTSQKRCKETAPNEQRARRGDDIRTLNGDESENARPDFLEKRVASAGGPCRRRFVSSSWRTHLPMPSSWSWSWRGRD